MRAKFGLVPTAVSKNLSLKFISRCRSEYNYRPRIRLEKDAEEDLNIIISESEQFDTTEVFCICIVYSCLPVCADGVTLHSCQYARFDLPILMFQLNLASQSVLEGLNACLDHRAEVYVPELGKTFRVEHGKTRLFACQNPLSQGGGRKGLPKSFLNRFTQVKLDCVEFFGTILGSNDRE